jgi:hypothetical protein
MSVDIEGLEYEILHVFPFNSKYKIYCLSIEHGFNNELRDKVFNLMTKNNYIRYKELLWDDIYVLPELLTKKVVNSFDFFDTIVHRHYFTEDSIFKLIEKNNNLTNFVSDRQNAEATSDTGLTCIYEKLKQYNEKIKQDEFELEKSHLFLNSNNYMKIRESDIIISDTFYSEKELEKILLHFDIKNKFYCSKNGKRTGIIFPKLLNEYIIVSHLGDNPISDGKMALQFNIGTHVKNFGKFNNWEETLYNYLPNVSFLLRRIRLESQINFNDILESFQYIFTCNLLIYLIVKQYCQKHNFNNILLTMRDCCLLSKIFETFKLECGLNFNKFYTSRICYEKSSNDFVTYVNTLIDVNTKNLIIDMNGTGKSINNFITKNNIINLYPLYIVKFGNFTEYDCIYNNQKYIDILEHINCDIYGKTIDIENNKPIKECVDYLHINDIILIHKLFDKACELLNIYKIDITKDINSISTENLDKIFDLCITLFKNTNLYKKSLEGHKN